MRIHVAILLVVFLGVATSNAYFIKKPAVTLAGVKLNLVKDATAAITDFKESVSLKGKAIKGGLKAIGTAKVGLVKGIKHAKIGVLKGIAGAKLAKLAAIKAGKILLVKTLVAAKVAPLVKIGAIKAGIAALPLASGSFEASKLLSGASFLNTKGSVGQVQESLVSKVGNILPALWGNGGGNLALFPAPSVVPSRINIVTYNNGAQSSSGSSSSGYSAFDYSPRPSLGDHQLSAQPSAFTVPSDVPLTSYGTPIGAIPPSTSYGIPIRR